MRTEVEVSDFIQTLTMKIGNLSLYLPGSKNNQNHFTKSKILTHPLKLLPTALFVWCLPRPLVVQRILDEPKSKATWISAVQVPLQTSCLFLPSSVILCKCFPLSTQ